VSARHDVIVVGARCAGAPTAMLLARAGRRVLVVDRATFPSDTISTHIVHPLGVAALARWGLLERLAATGCPPIERYAFDVGPVTVAGTPGTPATPHAYCPRRTILDQLLVDAAREAGAEVREGFAVEEIVIENDRVAGICGHERDGATITERAEIVIGADGRHSQVARAVRAEAYLERPPLEALYYAYWSELPVDGVELYMRPERGFAAAPTHDGLTMVVALWPIAEFHDNKKDIEGHYAEVLALVPEFAERVRGATRATRLVGGTVPGYFRRPYGPGWALVGDAGYCKDPITAQGITDAFLDAERCSAALLDPVDGAMDAWHQARDARARPIYDFTCELASLGPTPPEMAQMIAAIAGNPPLMDAFVQHFAGTITGEELFARLGMAPG
jgi:2-polyprenyl-6-methoxyphenol hydroxylase-like FAD-dependent oxidoreductase